MIRFEQVYQRLIQNPIKHLRWSIWKNRSQVKTIKYYHTKGSILDAWKGKYPKIEGLVVRWSYCFKSIKEESGNILLKMDVFLQISSNALKIFAKKSCKCKQIRSDRTPASLIVLKHCLITYYISRLNEITRRRYIKTILNPKGTFKQL